jgi:catechol 2,3-dioxygenase-like lactoylglutathione lyase family enzyme
MNIDHVVLWVEDPQCALEFYVGIVGLTPVRQQEYAGGAAPFPSVRLNDATILDLMAMETLAGTREFTGGANSGGAPVNHLCFSLEAGAYAALRNRLLAAGIQIKPGSERSFGARGFAARSEYFCDPDGNVIEIRYYD